MLLGCLEKCPHLVGEIKPVVVHLLFLALDLRTEIDSLLAHQSIDVALCDGDLPEAGPSHRHAFCALSVKIFAQKDGLASLSRASCMHLDLILWAATATHHRHLADFLQVDFLGLLFGQAS